MPIASIEEEGRNLASMRGRREPGRIFKEQKERTPNSPRKVRIDKADDDALGVIWLVLCRVVESFAWGSS